MYYKVAIQEMSCPPPSLFPFQKGIKSLQYLFVMALLVGGEIRGLERAKKQVPVMAEKLAAFLPMVAPSRKAPSSKNS